MLPRPETTVHILLPSTKHRSINMKEDEETGVESAGPGSKSKCNLVVVESKRALSLKVKAYEMLALAILGLIMIMIRLLMHLGPYFHLN